MTTTMKKVPAVKKVSAPKTKKMAAPVEAPSIEAAPAVPEQVIPATVIAKKRAKKSSIMKEAPLPTSVLAGDPYPIAEEAVAVIEEAPKPEVPAWIPVDLTIDQKNLVDALTQLTPMISNRSTLPVLAFVKVVASIVDQTIEIHATNLEMYGIVTVPAEVSLAGTFLAPYKELLDIVKPFKKASLHLSVPEDILIIKCKGMSVQLHTMDLKEYPAVSFVEGNPKDETITLPVATFSQMVRMVAPAATDDQTRPVFCGIHMSLEKDVFQMEAADAFRLHFMRETIKGAGTWQGTWLLPEYNLSALLKHLPKQGDITLTSIPERASATLTCGSLKVGTRTIEAQFPRIAGVIPKDSSLPLEFLAEGVSLRSALEGVKNVVKDNANITRLEVKDAGISVIAEKEGMPAPLEVEVEGTSKGEGRALYNWKYLSDLAKIAPAASMLQFLFDDKNRPAVIRISDVPAFMGVLMPMSEPKSKK